MSPSHVPEAVLSTEAQCEAKGPWFLPSGSKQSRIMLLGLRHAFKETFWYVNSGPHPQIGILAFLKYLILNSQFVKHWSSAMGEVHYYAHVTDEETEAERLNNLHRNTQPIRGKADIGTLLYFRANVVNYYAIYPVFPNLTQRIIIVFTEKQIISLCVIFMTT